MAEIVEDWEKFYGGRALLAEIDDLLLPDENGISTVVPGLVVADVHKGLAFCLAKIEERTE